MMQSQENAGTDEKTDRRTGIFYKTLQAIAGGPIRSEAERCDERH